MDARSRSFHATSPLSSAARKFRLCHLLNGLYDAKLDHQPVVAAQTPTVPVNLACAHAMNAAFSSCRT
jgi:hypothetical protein